MINMGSEILAITIQQLLDIILDIQYAQYLCVTGATCSSSLCMVKKWRDLYSKFFTDVL